jgi:octopine/nopaline transport system substrate-binding protein
MIAGLATVAALSAVPASAKDWTKVSIGLEGAYPPWNLTNSDGTLGGFEPELIADLCKRMNVECTLGAYDWDTMIESLNAGKFDVIMDALSITPERQQAIDFTIPYAATPTGFAVVKGSPLENMDGTGQTVKLTGDAATDKAEVEKLRAAFAGKTMGIQAATVYASWAHANFPDTEIREYKTTAERDLDLVAGRIDVGFDDATSFKAAFATPGNEDLEFTGPEIGGAVWGPGMGLGIRKSDTDLTAKFNTAIEAALADGTVKTLSEKWFGLSIAP